MAKVLRNLEIVEVSLVDKPANPASKIMLSKRATKMDPGSTDVHVDTVAGGTPKGPVACRACGQSVDNIDKFCKGCGVPFQKAAKTKVAPGTPAKMAMRKVAEFVAMAVSKGYMDGQAQTLDEAIEDQEERELLSALWDALYSIFNDDTVSEAEQASMVGASFDQFLSRLQPQPSPQPKEARMDLSKVSAEVKAHIEKLEADLAEAKKATPAQPEDLLKGLSPEVKSIVEKAQRDAASATAEVLKIRDEQREREFIGKARDLKALPGASATDLGKLMKVLAEKAPEEFTKLEALLKAWNDAIETGALFTEKGRSGHDAEGSGSGSATERVNALVKARVEKGASKTEADAISVVMRENPRLYADYRKETAVKV